MTERPITLAEQTFNSVYYVHSNDQYITPIAIRPEWFAGKMEWGDTSRGKGIGVKSIHLMPSGGIVAVSDRNHTYNFIPLTMEIFERYVKDRIFVFRDPPKTTEQLQRYYLTTNFNAYELQPLPAD